MKYKKNSIISTFMQYVKYQTHKETIKHKAFQCTYFNLAFIIMVIKIKVKNARRKLKIPTFKFKLSLIPTFKLKILTLELEIPTLKLKNPTYFEAFIFF